MTDEHEQILTPHLAGWLTMPEIATLAQIELSTLRSYRALNRAGFPREDSRSGSTPMWRIEAILTWLANRPKSKTIVEQLPDGRLKVTEPTQWVQPGSTAKTSS